MGNEVKQFIEELYRIQSIIHHTVVPQKLPQEQRDEWYALLNDMSVELTALIYKADVEMGEQ